MFRLTILLLAGLGLAMYFADSFPDAREKPAVVAVQDVTPSVEPSPQIEVKVEPEITATAVPIPSTPKPETPVVAKAEIETEGQETLPAPSYLDLFQSPAIVGSDGTLQIAAAEIPETDVNIALQEALGQQDEPLTNVQFVTGERVNVRQGPTTSAAVVDQVVFAEAVEVLTEPENGWVLIRIEGDGVEGYMASRFLQSNDPQG